MELEKNALNHFRKSLNKAKKFECLLDYGLHNRELIPKLELHGTLQVIFKGSILSRTSLLEIQKHGTKEKEKERKEIKEKKEKETRKRKPSSRTVKTVLCTCSVRHIWCPN